MGHPKESNSRCPPPLLVLHPAFRLPVPLRMHNQYVKTLLIARAEWHEPRMAAMRAGRALPSAKGNAFGTKARTAHRARISGAGLQFLVVLHVRHACLIGAGILQIQQRLLTGRPYILRAEAQLALPRQAHADAQIDAAPTLTGIDRGARQRRLQRTADDRAA